MGQAQSPKNKGTWQLERKIWLQCAEFLWRAAVFGVIFRFSVFFKTIFDVSGPEPALGSLSTGNLAPMHQTSGKAGSTQVCCLNSGLFASSALLQGQGQSQNSRRIVAE